jgi:hypothetical protein
MNEKDEIKSLDVEKKQSYEDKICSSSEISEEESKISESSSECKCDVEHDNDDDNGEMEACHQKVIVTETSLIRKKVPDFKFYEKQLQEKKEHEKKYEIIRKKREEPILESLNNENKVKENKLSIEKEILNFESRRKKRLEGEKSFLEKETIQNEDDNEYSNFTVNKNINRFQKI